MLFLELVCWAGLLLFFWTWKGRSGQARPASEIQALSACGSNAAIGRQTGCIQILQNAEPIGRYRDMPIYRHVLIEGKVYQFDCIDVEMMGAKNPVSRKRRIAPGLIYEECTQPASPPSD